MEKPTIEQTAWIFEKICEALDNGSSFLHLVNDIMKYEGACRELYEAGGMYITNSICSLRDLAEQLGTTSRNLAFSDTPKIEKIKDQ